MRKLKAFKRVFVYISVSSSDILCGNMRNCMTVSVSDISNHMSELWVCVCACVCVCECAFYVWECHFFFWDNNIHSIPLKGRLSYRNTITWYTCHIEKYVLDVTFFSCIACLHFYYHQVFKQVSSQTRSNTLTSRLFGLYYHKTKHCFYIFAHIWNRYSMDARWKWQNVRARICFSGGSSSSFECCLDLMESVEEKAIIPIKRIIDCFLLLRFVFEHSRETKA